MTSTVRETILAAIQTKIDAAVGTTATSYRSRLAALARQEGVAVCLQPEEEGVQNQGMMGATGVIQRDLSVLITVIARGPIPDKVADPVVNAVQAAIGADLTLGGLVFRVIEQGTRWDFEVADASAVGVDIRYSIRYLTPAASLASFA